MNKKICLTIALLFSTATTVAQKNVTAERDAIKNTLQKKIDELDDTLKQMKEGLYQKIDKEKLILKTHKAKLKSYINASLLGSIRIQKDFFKTLKAKIQKAPVNNLEEFKKIINEIKIATDNKSKEYVQQMDDIRKTAFDKIPKLVKKISKKQIEAINEDIEKFKKTFKEVYLEDLKKELAETK